MRWFRFYDKALDDPKVQQLAPPLFKAWVNLLCLASKHEGRIPADFQAIGFRLRSSAAKAKETVSALTSAGLLEHDGDAIVPHNWDGWQYASDSSAERMRRHRQRQRDGDVTSHVTGGDAKSDAADSDTESDTEQNRTEAETEGVGARASRSPTATRLPEGWQPSAELLEWAAQNEPAVDANRETLKFLDYWRAASGAKARKHDWDAAWRTWIRKAGDDTRRGPDGQRPGAARFKNGFAQLLADDHARAVAADGLRPDGTPGAASRARPLG